MPVNKFIVRCGTTGLQRQALRRTLMLLFLYIAVVPPALSALSKNLQFTNYGIEDGLTILPVTSILQDRQGYFWLGGRTGLCRYDGYDFEPFGAANDPRFQLSNQQVNAIYEDGDGYLWITTEDGVNRIDPWRETNQVIHPNPPDPEAHEKSMYGITEERAGVFLIGGINFLHRYDVNARQWTSFRVFPNDHQKSSFILGLHHLVRDPAGKIWFGSCDGFYQFDPSAEKVTRIDGKKYSTFPVDQELDDLSGAAIYTVVMDEDGIIWIGVWHGGLSRFDPVSKTFLTYKNAAGIEPDRVYYTIPAIHPVADGKLWLGTDFYGIFLFDPKTATQTLYNIDIRYPSNFSANTIYCFYQDRSGSIWVASDNKLSRYSESEYQFQSIRYLYEDANNFQTFTVYSLCEGTDGTAWLGTLEDGLVAYNPQSNRFTPYFPFPESKNQSGPNTITALCADPGGGVWVGSWKNGVLFFNPQSGKFDPLEPFNEETKKGVRGGETRSIRVLSDGNVWIGNAGYGITVYDPKTGLYSYLDNLSSSFVFSIYEDRSGIVWIGTGGYGVQGNGLNRYDPVTKEVKQYLPSKQPELHGELQGDSVYYIYEDRAGRLWLGTDRGLVRMDRDTETFAWIRTDSGLQIDDVSSIIEDNEGALWISASYRKIIRYQPDTGRMDYFDSTDGLTDQSFLKGVGVKTRSGDFYFGGSSGLSVVEQGAYKINTYSPPVVLKNIEIMGAPYSLNRFSTSGELHLPYGSNTLRFEFALLNFINSSRNRFEYRLNPLQERWNEIDSRQLDLILHPGSYTVQVRGINNDGILSESITEIPIRIDYPFWQTAWFLISTACALLLLFAFLYAYRVRRIRSENRRLESLVRIRTNQLSVERDYLRSVILTSPSIIIGFTLDGKITQINPSGLQLTGVPVDQIIGQSWWNITPIEVDRQFIERIHQSLLRGEFEDREITVQFHTRKTHTLLLSFVYHLDEEGQPVEILLFGHDITEHVQRELLEISSREKRSIGQEIHDSICQTLTGVTTMCDALALRKDSIPEQESAIIARIRDHLRSVTTQSRKLARGLYLHELEQHGLKAALKELTITVETLFGTPCRLVADAMEEPDDMKISTQIYRIVQEAAYNAAKHGKAYTIVIHARSNETAYIFQVCDDGVGFDYHERKNSGMGIKIMQYRSRSINAELDVDSVIERGTTVTCRINKSQMDSSTSISPDLVRTL